MIYIKKTTNWLMLGLAVIALSFQSCDQQFEEAAPIQDEILGQDIREEFIPGQYIVVLHETNLSFRKTDKYEDVQASMRVLSNDLVAKYGVSEEKVKLVFGNLMTGFSAELSPEQVTLLRKDPAVNYIEQDRIAYAFQTEQSNATWGLDRTDQRDLPLDSKYRYVTDGEGVDAYIFDTGIRYTHSEFGGRAKLGRSYYGDDGSDLNGHGTHVAGTVGGNIYGVAKKATLISMKVLGDNGSGYFSDIINGLDWVRANKKGPSVINMSLGGSGTSSTLNTAVKNLLDAGVPVIVAAGNSNDDASKFTPANAPEAFAVGSTTSTDARSSFSNFGSTVRLFAPGSSIKSAYYRSDTDLATLSGTSMASPHAAGVAALYFSANPTATGRDVYDYLVNGATPNKVSSAGTGSPNLLLYSLADATITPEDPVTPDDPVSSEPKIDFFSTQESSNKNFTRSVATWKVSDAGGKLQSVRLELLSNGSTVNTINLQVTGTFAEGQNELSARGSADQVRITVTADGKTITRTHGLTQGDTGNNDPAPDPDPEPEPEPDPNDPPVDSDPVINSFTVSSRSSGPWNNGLANWTVGDVAGALQSVTIELLGSSGQVLETSLISVSGSSASGSTELRSRSIISSMRITVQAGGITTSDTKAF